MTLQHKIILYFITVGATSFALGTLVLLLQGYLAKASGGGTGRTGALRSALILGCFAAALAFTLIAILTSMQTINALRWVTILTSAPIKFLLGVTIIVLEWLLVGVNALVCICSLQLNKGSGTGGKQFGSDGGAGGDDLLPPPPP